MRYLLNACVALCLLLTAIPSLAQPANDPALSNLLLRMDAAVRTLDYQGSFIYEHDGRIDAMRIFHAGDGRGRERLISMSGPRSEIVRDGNAITCLQSGSPTVLFQNNRGMRLLPLVPDTAGGAFAQHYGLRAGGEDRVAGYLARIVEIVPRDEWRYGYRLWIEQNTDMLLRSAVIDAAQRSLEQFMFVALDIGAEPKSSDLESRREAGLSAPPSEIPLEGAPQWRVSDLPAGFRLVRAQRSAQGAAGAEHQMYSDGLANVSVYVDPSAAQSVDADKAMTRGVISLHSHRGKTWKVTVLGDVPPATATRIAVSVQPVAAEADLK